MGTWVQHPDSRRGVPTSRGSYEYRIIGSIEDQVAKEHSVHVTVLSMALGRFCIFMPSMLPSAFRRTRYTVFICMYGGNVSFRRVLDFSGMRACIRVYVRVSRGRGIACTCTREGRKGGGRAVTLRRDSCGFRKILRKSAHPCVLPRREERPMCFPRKRRIAHREKNKHLPPPPP